MRSTAATKLWRVSHGPSDLRLRWRRAFRAAFLLCAPFILLYTAFRLFGVRINLTSSSNAGSTLSVERHQQTLSSFAPKEKQQVSRFNGATVPREARVPTEVHH